MAIYHYSAQVVSRSGGGSSVAKAAYRTGQNLTNERTAEVHDYTKKRGVVDHAIFVPPNSPEWAKQTASLWNGVEVAETRKDAQLCREINVAIPAELSKAQAVALAKYYGQWLSAQHGTAVEIAVHRDDAKDRMGNKKPDAERGYHFHIMESLRVLGPDGFGEKAVSQKVFKGAKGPAEANRRLEEERVQWAHVANKALALAGHSARIDHRTLKAQGIDRKPDPTLGVAVTALNRKGKPSHVMERIEQQKALDSVDRTIADLEAQRDQVQAKINHQEQQNDRLRAAAFERIGANLSAADHAGQRAAAASQHLGQADRRIAEAGRNQRARRAEEVARTAGLVVGRAVAQAARTAGQAVAINAQRQAQAEAKRQVWRGHLTERRKAWGSTSVALTSAPAKDGKPTVYRYSEGKAKGFAAVIDYGDRLKPAGSPDKITDYKIAALLQIAQEKGWKEITVKGDPSFRQRVADAAVVRGLGLADADLKAYAAPAIREREAARLLAQAEAVQAEQKRIQAQMKEQEAAKAPPRPAPGPLPSKPSIPPPQAVQAVPEAPQGPTLTELRTELANLDKQAGEIHAEPVLRPLGTLTEEEAQYEANKEANKAAGVKLHPEHRHEYAHQHGNGLKLHVAKLQREEHAKTQRPLMIGKAAWDAEAKRLNDQVAELTGAVAGDSFKLMRRGKQIQAERIQESAKRAEQIKQQAESKAERLAALAAKRATIEGQIKHPRFAEQIKQEQEQERQRQQAAKQKSHSHSTPSKSKGRGGWGIGD